ncbi:hypothetical protein [Leuconostoc suionicum]
MIMYEAVGWHSQNEYMASNTMRKLQKEYPVPRPTSRGLSTQHLY